MIANNGFICVKTVYRKVATSKKKQRWENYSGSLPNIHLVLVLDGKWKYAMPTVFFLPLVHRHRQIIRKNLTFSWLHFPVFPFCSWTLVRKTVFKRQPSGNTRIWGANPNLTIRSSLKALTLCECCHGYQERENRFVLIKSGLW
jgi:hypothetical protein